MIARHDDESILCTLHFAPTFKPDTHIFLGGQLRPSRDGSNDDDLNPRPSVKQRHALIECPTDLRYSSELQNPQRRLIMGKFDFLMQIIIQVLLFNQN